ncbi:MAG: HDIG domain-containing protein [Planctomycetes bacterium]|nr:HDIG domain-containing protein [Planctomycetota bacterium]
MALFKSDTSRRREVRKNIPRQRPALREMIGRGQVVWGLGISVLFIAAAAVIVIQSRAEPAYVPGDLIDRPVVARVSFNSLDLAATAQKRDDARRTTPDVYMQNKGFLDETRKAFAALPDLVATAASVRDVEPKLVERYGLSDEIVTELKTFHIEGGSSPAWMAMVSNLIEQLKRTAVLSNEDYQIEKVNLPPTIRIQVSDEQSPLVWEGDMVNVTDPKDVTKAAERLASSFPASLRTIVKTYMLKTAQPTYTFHPQLTEKAKDDEAAKVQDVKVDYTAGQVLIRAGTTLDDSGYRLLQQHLAAIPSRQQLLKHLGLFVLVTLVSIALIGYVISFKPRIVEKPMRGAALAVLLIGVLALTWVSRGLPSQVMTTAPIVPILLMAIIVTIAYDQRFAMGITALHGLLIGLALNLSGGNYLVMMIGALVAIVQLRQVRNRSTLGRVGFITGLVVAAGIWAVGLSERNMVVDGLINDISRESFVGFVGTMLVSFVVLGTLPFIERAFKVTTAMTLLELGDMNHPLLRRLAQAAPGTFNHSLQVATLAEAAAESVGANGLLCRVGAYYHDIGKIHKPQYFVENQAGGPSRHDKLSPAMSLLIIVGHVKDGIEMAREYGLPSVLHHFIESHHGTTLVEYFFHAARKQKSEGEQPDEVEFRYPGPKPRTREAAILMICDCVESACRAMSEPTAVRIEQLVSKLVSKRLLDGQFDQCDITLAELRLIEQSVTKSLCAIYHGRISYPAEREPAPKADKERAVAG